MKRYQYSKMLFRMKRFKECMDHLNYLSKNLKEGDELLRESELFKADCCLVISINLNQQEEDSGKEWMIKEVSILENLFHEYPDDVEINWRYGLSLFSRMHFRQSKECFTRAVAFEPFISNFAIPLVGIVQECRLKLRQIINEEKKSNPIEGERGFDGLGLRIGETQESKTKVDTNDLQGDSSDCGTYGCINGFHVSTCSQHTPQNSSQQSD